MAFSSTINISSDVTGKEVHTLGFPIKNVWQIQRPTIILNLFIIFYNKSYLKLFPFNIFRNFHRKSSKVKVICFQRQSTSSKMKKKKKKSDENISVVLKSSFSHFFAILRTIAFKWDLERLSDNSALSA